MLFAVCCSLCLFVGVVVCCCLLLGCVENDGVAGAVRCWMRLYGVCCLLAVAFGGTMFVRLVVVCCC